MSEDSWELVSLADSGPPPLLPASSSGVSSSLVPIPSSSSNRDALGPRDRVFQIHRKLLQDIKEGNSIQLSKAPPPEEIKAKNLELNLQEVLSKPSIWKVDHKDNCALCLLCATWYNLENDPQNVLRHEWTKKHIRKLQALDDRLLQQQLNDMREEAIEQKKTEILEVTEDHPNFVRHSWVLGGMHILEIFKRDRETQWEVSQEFLVTAATDQDELVSEILEYLDEQ